MPLNHLLKTTALASIAALSLSGCYDHDYSTPAPVGQASTLRILHINDHHSNLNPATADLLLAGAKTRVETGGFPRVVAKFKQLEALDPSNVLKLHAGDAITGTLYYTLFKGEADAALMNQVCFDAFALGNHEFDSGDAGLKTFLDYLRGDGSCNTPVLAANVVPEVGVSPLAMTSATDYIRPYVIKEVNGEKYGIIGIDIAGKTKNSSNPDKSTQFLDEATTAQKYIDELKGKGIKKIVLMTHYQYNNDLALAQKLTDVDVIVGGDSHTLLGDQFNALGLSASGPYPTLQTNKNGEPVCIVQAWQYSSVVGELTVNFNENGAVSSCNGTPNLLLGSTFKRNNVALEGTEQAAVVQAISSTPALSIVEPDPTAVNILSGYAAQVTTLTEQIIGVAAENLCLVRFPGESRSTICTPEQTQSRGSDISNIVAKAFLEMSNTSDICIQNGGGVRTDIPMGNISIASAYKLLPFANTLTEIDMTGQQILDVLEEAMDYGLDANGSSGAYPYAAGLRWTLDLSKPFGQRFSNVQINPRVAGTWQAIDPAKTYKVVTNSYTAGGQDGYLTFGDIPASKKTDTFLDYAKSFVDYVQRQTAAGLTITKLPAEEYSTQSFINASGVQQ